MMKEMKLLKLMRYSQVGKMTMVEGMDIFARFALIWKRVYTSVQPVKIELEIAIIFVFF